VNDDGDGSIERTSPSYSPVWLQTDAVVETKRGDDDDDDDDVVACSILTSDQSSWA